MKLPDSCRELFLDGVTDAYFYAVRESSVSIPFSIQMILQITGCHFAGEALHVALSEGDNYIISDSITAKQTSSEGGNGTVFKFEIVANIRDGKENIPEIIKKMHGKDYYIVLRKQDDTIYLCHTLPGTFSITDSVTAQNDAETRSITATCQAMSEFIPITIA
ncbi:MAG: hypothetical protein JTJ26_07385 [Prevotella sp.]|nr:hypothetical protein [Prevotella sp.]